MISREIPGLSSCEKEAIQTPGSIQTFGAILISHPETGEILQTSENLSEYLGVNPAKVLGKKISDLFPEEAGAELDRNESFSHGNLRVFPHLHDGLRLWEIEKCPAVDSSRIATHLRHGLNHLQNAATQTELAQVVAEKVQKLTGFDRVMIYKFHADFHGEVIGEKNNSGVESYFGLHYPASDIPAIARSIFLTNWVRMIPNVNYGPVPLTPIENKMTKRPVDLGRALLRSVSPIHIEYLKNMGVGATLTISLLADGKLWGLVACHHLTERYIHPDLRDACEMVGRYASAVLPSVLGKEKERQRERLREIQKTILSRISHSEHLGMELSNESPNVLDLLSGTGAASALYFDDDWVTVGDVPAQEDLRKIVDWLEVHHRGEAVFATHALSSVFPEAAEFADIASGMLAILIPKTSRTYILVFRPELPKTIEWAGNPEKMRPSSDGLIHPRESFASWKESVRGLSAEWSPREIEAAEDLRHSILALDLRRQFVKEQKARAEAVCAMESREQLMAVLSHDLKNPIGSIQLTAKLLERSLLKDGQNASRDHAVRIFKAAENMSHLINDILNVTQLESGNLNIEKKREEVRELLAETIEMILPIAVQQGVELCESIYSAECHALCDRERVIQVLSNLIGNAIKFTPVGGKVEVAVDKCGPEFLKFSIRDTGPGIPLEHQTLIFDRFWQANQTKRLGTGLGLAISKGIVESHGGEIWVESSGSGGSTFHFTLPIS